MALEAYFRAWVSNDPDEVAALFSRDAFYHTGPFAEPWRGRGAIVAAWVGDPEQQAGVRYAFEPLAVAGDAGIAAWRVSYTRNAPRRAAVEVDGVLVAWFDDDGRCAEHREWAVRRERPAATGDPDFTSRSASAGGAHRERNDLP